jgi:hypothetical protein
MGDCWFVLAVRRASDGSVVLLAVSGSAVSALSDELASLVARARASAPPQPALPLFTEGEVVEPREVRGGTDLSDAASNTASTPAWCQPPPRRSLREEREEREARDLLALVKVTQEARRLAQRLRDARRAREARQLQQLVLLAAALRRAGFPR